MKNKKNSRKIVAMVLSLLILLIGTYAWQSFSQEAKNELKGELLNPGGRLHDHFDGLNKYTFVENFNLLDIQEGEDGGDVFVRMRMDEYMETGTGAGTGVTNGLRTIRSDIPNPYVSTPLYSNKNTWDTYDLLKNKTGGIRSYWYITLSDTENGQTHYMPTFNKRNDNLDSDINGTYLAGNDPEGEMINEPYSDYLDYTLVENQEPKEGYSVYSYNEDTFDPDAFTEEDDVRIDEENDIYYVKETHTPTATLEANKIISMSDWMKLTDESQIGDFWVCDIDGWAYWAAPLEPGTATSSLFGMVHNVKEPAGSWYYTNNVVAQLASAGDWGDSVAKTGMYGGNGITNNAVGLLNMVADLTRVLRLEIVNTDMSSLNTKEILMGTKETIGLVADVKVTYPTGSDKETAASWTITEVLEEGKESSGITQARLDTYLVEGVFTADEAMENHTFKITAQSLIDTSFTDSVTITVLDVDELELFAAPGNQWNAIQPGEEVVYVATLSNGDEHSVTWSVSGLAEDSTTNINTRGVLSVDPQELYKQWPGPSNSFENNQYYRKYLTITAQSNIYSGLTASHTISVRDWSYISDQITAVENGTQDILNIDGMEWHMLAEQEINGRNAVQLFCGERIETASRYSKTNVDVLQWSDSYVREYLRTEWLPVQNWLSRNVVTIPNIDTGYYLTNYTETEGDDDNDPVVNEEYLEYTSETAYLLSYEEWDNLPLEKKRYSKGITSTGNHYYWLRTPSAMSSGYAVYITNSSTDALAAAATMEIYTRSETTSNYMRPTLWVYR